MITAGNLVFQGAAIGNLWVYAADIPGKVLKSLLRAALMRRR